MYINFKLKRVINQIILFTSEQSFTRLHSFSIRHISDFHLINQVDETYTRERIIPGKRETCLIKIF